MRRPLLCALVTAAVLAAAVAAAARTPDAVEMERVKELAHQMDLDADEAYVEAVYAAGDAPNAEQTEALQKLYVLKESASYFNEQVQASYEAPAHTLVAFERLNDDFIEARQGFTKLGAYSEQRELFETIEDNVGNIRYYYVLPGRHQSYPDYEVYPYYPGFHLFVHVYGPNAPYHYRHVHRWHLHPKYFEVYPHRHEYRRGYGRHKVHYAERAKHHWHKRIVKKTIPVGKPKPKPAPKPGPGPGSGGKGKGK
jgi:hypothetical protein